MKSEIKILIIILTILFLLNTFNNEMSTRGSESRIREHFNWRFDSLEAYHTRLPATVYDRVNDKCLLVYPDTVIYISPISSIYGKGR